LGQKQRTALIAEVAPAYRSGDPLRILNALSPLMNGLDDGQMAEANALLAEHEVPSIQQLLGDARLTLVHQGKSDRLPKPGPRELVMTLDVLKDRAEQVLHDLRQHPVMSNPLHQPAEFGKYDDLFWEIHMLDNRLVAARRIADYCAELSDQGKRLNRRSLDEKQKLLLGVDFKNIALDIGKRRQQLKERGIELRVYRLEDADQILAESNDARQRILAARAIDSDGDKLTQFLKDSREQQTKFVREELRDVNLLASVENSVVRGKRSAGDLIEKSRLLFDGLYWWTRGRYGSGPYAWGLLKSPLVMRSQLDMRSLYMPATIPRPTDPTDRDFQPVPTVDRRHHYAWAVENRPIISTENVHPTPIATMSSSTVLKQVSITVW